MDQSTNKRQKLTICLTNKYKINNRQNLLTERQETDTKLGRDVTSKSEASGNQDTHEDKAPKTQRQRQGTKTELINKLRDTGENYI